MDQKTCSLDREQPSTATPTFAVIAVNFPGVSSPGSVI